MKVCQAFVCFLYVSFYQFFYFSSSETAKGLPELMFCVQPSAVETPVSGSRRLWRRKESKHIKSMSGATHLKGHCRVQNVVDLNRRPSFSCSHLVTVCDITVCPSNL